MDDRPGRLDAVTCPDERAVSVQIEPGQLLLGRYRVAERLGMGAMGEVWKAHDDHLDRGVAVKVLAHHLSANARLEEAFRREAALAGSLTDDHVVAVHDSGTTDGTMVLVMELVDGGNLARRLAENGRIPVPEALRITREMLSGLSAAHEAGLVHRDVKPANVVFTPAGRVKLTDFGIARLAAGETAQTSEFFGSAPYLAPERADGQRAVPASDVYAAGCILYELLTGISPFIGETPAVTIARHLRYRPPPPSTVARELSPEIDAVTARALAKDPSVRYRDAREMLLDLQGAENAGRVAAATVAFSRPLSLPERRAAKKDPHASFPVVRDRRNAALLLAAGALIGATVLTVVMLALGLAT